MRLNGQIKVSHCLKKNDNLSLHTANALLSKISLDKNDYVKALELSKDAATQGKIPLAAYVYGVSLIKQIIVPILANNG